MDLRNVMAHRKLTTISKDVEEFDGQTIKIFWVSTDESQPEKKELIIDIARFDIYMNIFGKVIEQLSELFELINQKGDPK